LKAGFFWKIFGGTVAVILITAFVVYLAALPTISRSLEQETEQLVQNEARVAAELCREVLDPETGEFRLEGLRRAAERLDGSRLTLIGVDGTVLLDSQRDPATMDAHHTRPEILRPGEVVTRYSRTLEKEMTYVALPIEVDGALYGYSRMAVAVEDREGRVADLRGAIRRGALLAGMISLVLAGIFAGRVTRPLSEIAELVGEIGSQQTTRRLDVRRDDELGRLAQAVNHMADDLQGQVARVERDRAEREAIFSAMADGLLAVDHQQNVLFVNRPARSLLKIQEERVKGRPVWELVRNAELIDVIERCLASEERARGQTRIAGDDGPRLIELTAVPMAGSAGTHRGCVLELRDVTDLRRLEAVRRDFVSNVSHELKTPLTAMRGYLEAVLEDAEMPESLRQSFVGKAHRNTERLAAIVGDLLSLSRLESEEHALAFEPLDVNELVGIVVGDLRDLAESRRQTVTVEVPEESPHVDADSQALGMAVSNLLSNALQYSPEGEAVALTVREVDDEVRIEVADRGPGIPAHEQERIFERFYRVDKARSRKLGGTGLGLAIVRHVMAAHQGRVELRSTPGVGSSFCLVLPLSGDK
jgi:two-component system phosphate regulon sensor histidine kinase PhoR